MRKSYSLKSNKVSTRVTTTQVKKKDSISQRLKSLLWETSVSRKIKYKYFSLLLSTAKNPGFYIQNKHNNALSGGEKKAD